MNINETIKLEIIRLKTRINRFKNAKEIIIARVKENGALKVRKGISIEPATTEARNAMVAAKNIMQTYSWTDIFILVDFS